MIPHTYDGPTVVRAMRAAAHALDRDPASAIVRHLCLWADANGASGGTELVVVATDGKFLLEHRILPQGCGIPMVQPTYRPLEIVGAALPVGFSEGMILDWQAVNRVALTDLMSEPKGKVGDTKARTFRLDGDGLHIAGPGLTVSVLRPVKDGAFIKGYPNYSKALEASAPDAKVPARIGAHAPYLARLKDGLALNQVAGVVMTHGRGLIFRPMNENKIGTVATGLVMPISLPDPI